MSSILRDSFFDGFEDMMCRDWPFCAHTHPLALDNESKKEGICPKRVKRDVITPYSGFGRMDLKETDTQYDLRLDLPGMNKSDIQVTAENNVLSIEGERKDEVKQDSKNGKIHFTERHFGKFHREVSLPANANVESIHATYTDGVLEVSIPKKEHAPTKQSVSVQWRVCWSIFDDSRIYKAI